MALSAEESGNIRKLVAIHKSFMVSLKQTYWLHKTEDPEILSVRDFLRRQVLTPLLQASTKAVVYGVECVEHDFEHEERKNFDRLLVRKGAIFEIRLENRHSLVTDFPDFWADSLFDVAAKRYYSRGNVLFLLDDLAIDFEKLFSCFARVDVVSNLSSALGRSLYNRARKYAADHCDKTAVALLNGSSLVFFPGSEVIDARLEQAIACLPE